MRQLLIVILSLASTVMQAQVNIKGKVVQEKGEKPLAFSSVMLLSATDSTLVDGTITDENGDFVISEIGTDPYLILIKRIGFKDNILATQRYSADTDLGLIVMKEDVTELDEVVVTGRRSTMETQLGKRVLNIGEDLSATGASVIEALERLPSVSTDIQGNISIRGSSNVIIYVNGKETRRDSRSLRLLGAAALQKIEVITNPSAKYDAEGVGGIINLVFKKDASKNFKLETMTSITSPYRLGLGINNQVSSQKFTGYLNASINRSRYENSEDQIRQQASGDLRRYENLVSGLGRGRTTHITTGITYDHDTTFSVNMEFNYWRWIDPEDREQVNNFLYSDDSRQQIRIANYSRELEDEITFSLSLDKRWSDEHELKFLINAGGEDEGNTAFYNLGGTNLTGTPLSQSINSSEETENQRIYQLTLDYTRPFFGFGSLETGGKFDYIDYDISQSLDFVSDALFLPQNDFGIILKKYAYYAIHQKKWSKFEYGIGARLEHFSTEANQLSIGAFNEQSVTKLFPSVQLLYRHNNEHHLAFNYSKRINRPGFFDLNPFVSFTDPLVLSTGNPNLEPEFADSYELSYQLNKDNLSLEATGFSRVTTNLIQQTVTQFDEDRLLLSYANYGKRVNNGIELSSMVQVLKILELSGDFSLYNTSFQSNEGDVEVRFNDQTTWQLSTRQRLTLSDDLTVELSQNYRAPRIGVQTRDLEYYYVNAALRKSFGNNRAVLTLNFQDIFDTRIFNSEVKGEDFLINNSYKFQTRRLTLELRYKLFD